MFANSLAAFIQQRQVLNTTFFETQGSNEKIHLLLRRHFITNLIWIITSIILFLLPPIVMILYQNYPNIVAIQGLIEVTPLPEQILILLLYYLLVIYFIYLKFLDWFYNVLIVTNKRVVDINFIPPFQRQTTQAQLEEIQDVRETQRGVFAVLFNYGNIFIQTAGTKQNISLRRIPRPHTVHSMIIELMN